MSARLYRLFAPALALSLLAVGATASIAGAQETITVQIGPGRDDATATGTITLTAVGNQTRVDVNVAGTNPNMPAHIHSDACPGVGSVVFPLQNPMAGRSTTTIDAPLNEVLARGRSINFHRSPQEAAIYTGCGNLPAASAAAPAAAQPASLPRTGDVASLASLFAAVGASLAGAGLLLRRRQYR
jgi:LPXTG-motif cell wall-anchored protein